MSKIRVYKIRLYDVANDIAVISRRMATPEGANRMGGTLVDGTAYVVDTSELEAGEQWTAIGFDPVALGYSKASD